MDISTIPERDFALLRDLLRRVAGIHLPPSKKAMVSGRLAKRVRQLGLESYGEYFRLLVSGREPAELQTAVDLLTTNETYFFREPKHFDYLRDQILPNVGSGRPFRVWSAACATGEEPYSIAMVLADALGERPWEVLGSDISTRVLERARAGHYAMERAKDIPKRYLLGYCLKGIGGQAGTFLIGRQLRGRVRFQQINLTAALPQIGEFDVIFLRNVLIYFDQDMKRQVVANMVPQLKRGGWFIVGHSESLNGVTEALVTVMPTIYRRP